MLNLINRRIAYHFRSKPNAFFAKRKASKSRNLSLWKTKGDTSGARSIPKCPRCSKPSCVDCPSKDSATIERASETGVRHGFPYNQSKTQHDSPSLMRWNGVSGLNKLCRHGYTCQQWLTYVPIGNAVLLYVSFIAGLLIFKGLAL